MCPTTAKDAQTIETRMGLLINTKDTKQHSSFVTFCNKGKIVKGFRALDKSQNAPAGFTEALAKTVSGEVAKQVSAERK